MRNTDELVKTALAKTLNFSNTGTIPMDARLREDLHLDSMSSLMFLMRLEETIEGFFVDPETLQSNDLETVSSVVNYINLQLFSESEHVH